ncbi:Pinin-like protein 1 [Colletotrichum chlorophyti]|uniref:Pinin-like protein 1 n=1 Tax=Colletotrichum chlorophyti TaxID=708187 RepID=A0A1Q8RH69_9PEZI|nr:Pinin-like protein 1 [Colletotrichum chlorophyti]
MATVTEIMQLTETRAPAAAAKSELADSDFDTAPKRKASFDSGDTEETLKRPKTENDDHRNPRTQDLSISEADSGPRHGEAGNNTSRRAPVSKEEEKRRGKRLFGGLLSTLSQTNTSSQHKKRREIEQRQQERAQKQRAEDDKRRSEKLAQITEARWKEQIDFDEKVMRTRHANMLARAHSLRTKAEPPVYYRPWKPTKEQEDVIDEQIRDAKSVIAREEEAFKDHREEHERRYGRHSPLMRQEQPAFEIAESAAETLTEATLDAPAADTHNMSSHDHNSKYDREPPHDESGDVVEDAEEDMVIY